MSYGSKMIPLSPSRASPRSLTTPLSSFSIRRLSPITVVLLASTMVYVGLVIRRHTHTRSLSRQRRSIDKEDSIFSLLPFFNGGNSKEDTLPPLRMRQDSTQSGEKSLEDLVPLYVITPTYPRPEQLPELTRLSQTLMNVRNMVWLVVEDADTPTKLVEELLHRIKPIVPNYHLLGPMPELYRRTKDEFHLPKGVSNRNKGLDWVLQHGLDEGVVYFADDDNTYDLRLFSEIRNTKRVSVFPVGLVSGAPVSAPVVEDGELIGFYVGWDGNRKFPVDMAGFAFGVKHFKELSAVKKVTMPYIRGYEEDGFIKRLDVSREELEVLFPDKILVWHTRTSKMAFKPFKRLTRREMENTNLAQLNKYWCHFIGNFRCAASNSEQGKGRPQPIQEKNANLDAKNPRKTGFRLV